MKLTILSRDPEQFTDRNEAGLRLASELYKRIKDNPVVLGIPRGGVVIAHKISQLLNWDLDIMLAHKIRAPFHSELAIGAISEDGHTYLDEELLEITGVSSAYLNKEKKDQFEELSRRSLLFRSVCPKISLANRTVIVVDDGIATGSTVQAALWSARREKPAKLIGAFPVGPEKTLQKLSRDADEIICLEAPESFQAVGQFYNEFGQVEDEDVVKILKREYIRRKEKRGHHAYTIK